MNTQNPPEIDYPDDDGLPRSESQRQLEWMHKIYGCLDGLFRDDPEVFVAGNLLWYPVEGDNTTRRAPDVMVAFGRPKDDYRGSYRQWEEGGIAPQVVFEILAPTMNDLEIEKKFQFYERHGVEEYYLIDPDRVILRGWLRRGESLAEIEPTSGWVSPRLGTRFEVGDDLTIRRPDGRPFVTYREEARRADEAELRAEEAERLAEGQRLRAVESERLAEGQRLRAVESERLAEGQRLRADRLAARLRELGLED